MICDTAKATVLVNPVPAPHDTIWVSQQVVYCRNRGFELGKVLTDLERIEVWTSSDIYGDSIRRHSCVEDCDNPPVYDHGSDAFHQLFEQN